MKDTLNFDYLRNLTIGTVESVSPSEIKVFLEIDAPQNTAINTGTPNLFPRINGFVLIPKEDGAIVGIISWIGIEHSRYPSRKGFKDFDLIDLPFPLRKMSLSPIGTLKLTGKATEKYYELERGVFSFPSIGDSVILPTKDQLSAIVENKEKNANIAIGRSPIAGNTEVYINPDKLFGRHLAVLGNTGSGKSCSVAGLIRWCLIGAEKHKQIKENDLNARFIILDPNGEYLNSFNDLNTKVKRYKVEVEESEIEFFNQLKVPAWFWNSYEWCSFSNASGRTQRPILKRALRELKGSAEVNEEKTFSVIRRYFTSCFVSLKNDLNTGVSAYKDKSGRSEFRKKLQGYSKDARSLKHQSPEEIGELLENLAIELDNIAESKFKSFSKNGETITYVDPFEITDVQKAISEIEIILSFIGGVRIVEGANEDKPIQFNTDQLPDHIDIIAQEQAAAQFLDFLTMRIRTMLSDTRLRSIINNEDTTTLEKWLESYINGIVVIDLSLVPSEVVQLIVAVISRIIFEAIQRYRRMENKILPTLLVLEEAHNFIKKTSDVEENSASEICSQIFEKIAREGRKFGLSLLISSQRPSELSPTILSQCNTFLLHRIVNDRDQDLIRRLVPDNIGSLLRELPILPTRKSILLGWASPIPILIEMNELQDKYRPKSDDPDFWNVWTGIEKRDVDWKKISDEWQDIPKEVSAEDLITEPDEDLNLN